VMDRAKRDSSLKLGSRGKAIFLPAQSPIPEGG